MKISILIVTYGDRFQYLERVLNSCISEGKKDGRLFEIIVVDNASTSTEKITNFIKENENANIKHIILEENIGSAGGFSAGMKYFLETESDYLLILDDDNEPEKGFIDLYINSFSIFPKERKDKVILSGRRVFTDENLFYKNTPFYSPKYMFGYNLFNPKVVYMLIRKHFKKDTKRKEEDFSPIYIKKDLAWGGTIFSRKIIEKTGFPLEYLFTYEEDFEYGLRAIEKGFQIFQLYVPYIKDVDMSNRSDGFISILIEETGDFRTYYRVRNNAYLAHSLYKTNIVLLYLNFILTLFIFNFFYTIKYGFKNFPFRRNKIIYTAFKKGIKKDLSKFE